MDSCASVPSEVAILVFSVLSLCSGWGMSLPFLWLPLQSPGSVTISQSQSFKSCHRQHLPSQLPWNSLTQKDRLPPNLSTFTIAALLGLLAKDLTSICLSSKFLFPFTLVGVLVGPYVPRER